jgi:hypothetical protein
MIYYIIAYTLIGFIPAAYIADKNLLDFEKKNPPGTFRVRFKMIDGAVYNMVYGLSFMSALLLMPLSWIEFIYDKIKREKQK